MLCGIRFGFRLLTEYYLFLLKMHDGVVLIEANKFPSPYEVLFILIKSTFINKRKITNWVSVSLWSIIHSYGAQQLATYRMQKDSMFPSPCGVSFILICFLKIIRIHTSTEVSVSLRSIIHSYPMVKKVFYCNNFLECYRMIFLFLNFFCIF